MKFLLAFNVITYITNIAIYIIEPVGGTVFMFLLGCSHVIQALVFFFGYRHKITEVAKKHLEIYWIIVLSWITLLFIIVNAYVEGIPFYAGICMLIGIYFLFVNHQMSHKLEQKKDEIL